MFGQVDIVFLSSFLKSLHIFEVRAHVSAEDQFSDSLFSACGVVRLGQEVEVGIRAKNSPQG